MMGNNSTNTNTISPQVKQIKTMPYGVGNPGPALGQTHKYDGVRPVG